jgi:lipoprotein-anchoring transpeptidase ErfK/SrfK
MDRSHHLTILFVCCIQSSGAHFTHNRARRMFCTRIRTLLAGVLTTLLMGCASSYQAVPAPVTGFSPPQSAPLSQGYPHFDTPHITAIEHGISISLSAQHLCYFEEWTPLHCAPISSGTRNHPTPTGTFRISDKYEMYHSKTYPEPNGGAPMPYSMRFFKGYFIHAGYLPYPPRPDSKGCVRLPEGDARLLFGKVPTGTLVLITQ